ncbi:MAG: stage III sporulation protein AG, partial [Oscillospiraceae bacterium]|nr:stage III sporulation protein AG [Oscillospiraceae bacterium]
KAEREDGSLSQEKKTLVLDSGSSESVVVTKSRYPRFTGALIVCEGAGNASVRLALTQAVASLTGLTADRITVVKGKP